MLCLLANDLTMHLAFGRYVDDEVSLNQGLATQAPVCFQWFASFAVALFHIARRRQVIRPGGDRVLREFAFRTDDLAATAKAAPTAYGIYVYSQATGRIQ